MKKKLETEEPVLVNEEGELLNRTLEPPFFKTPWNHDRDVEAYKSATYCLDASLAQQHSKEEADINTIVRNFGVTGKLPIVPMPPPLDAFADTFDFQSAMNAIAAAKASFMGLEANVRDAFNNDPHKFVAYVDGVEQMKGEDRARELTHLRAMGLAVEPGPIADRTTLGDVLKAIKEQGTPPARPAGDPENGPLGR